MYIVHRNESYVLWPVVDVSLICRLGLTKEESLQQKEVQEEAKVKSGLCVSGESVRPQRGPNTRQRDGHFKKRSRPDLRTRSRRNIYKKQEPEQAGVAKDASAAPDVSLSKDTKTDLAGVNSTPGPDVSSATSGQEGPKCPSEPVASQIQAERNNLACASASPDRIPTLPQDTVDQETKDQKRKSFEQEASASFPEKKPRLEDRQSFRNTIESVHTEKPQPTKEEPKVPPIRVRDLVLTVSGVRFLSEELLGRSMHEAEALWPWRELHGVQNFLQESFSWLT